LYEELEDYSFKWIEELPKVLWGLRTQVSRATGYSPFFLVYRSEAVLPADLIWTSPKIEQYDEGEVEHTRRLELDITEEVRVNATLQSTRYLQGLRHHYDKNTQPFIIAKVTGPGSYELMTEDAVPVRNSWHIRQLRRFYA
jgi:hypothetical protein